jgi:serine/threonine-protein kinase
VTEQASATVADGHVISQTPVAGAEVAFGTAITIVVSTGPAPVVVPSVEGQTQAAATSAIEALGLTVTTTTAESSIVNLGHVISQTPADTTEVAPGSAVALVISLGVSVPDVEGATADAAKTALEAAGFTVSGTEDVFHPTIPAGNVVDVKVAPASAGVARASLPNATNGSTLILLVSAGPNPALANVRPIPTLSFWGLLALSALMPGMVSFMSRRKSRK